MALQDTVFPFGPLGALNYWDIFFLFSLKGLMSFLHRTFPVSFLAFDMQHCLNTSLLDSGEMSFQASLC